MGGIKKKHKLYQRPRKPFDRKRIADENQLVKEFGLKNKKEIWKAEAKISTIRRRTKTFISKSEEERKVFFEKLNKMGLKVDNISDALGLKKEDLLNRRLQTVVFKKGLTNTVREARQKIIHKYVLVDGNVVNSPSYLVTTDLENKLSILEAKPKKVKQEKVEEKEE
jgi:small subunit ribosomal protein S4